MTKGEKYNESFTILLKKWVKQAGFNKITKEIHKIKNNTIIKGMLKNGLGKFFNTKKQHKFN